MVVWSAETSPLVRCTGLGGSEGLEVDASSSLELVFVDCHRTARGIWFEKAGRAAAAVRSVEAASLLIGSIEGVCGWA